MTGGRAILSKIWSLFVDDAYFATSIVVWLCAIGLLARFDPTPFAYLVLFVGVAVILLHGTIRRGVDVALRLGRLADSGFGSRRLASAPRLLIASPGYLKARGTPVSPSDLDEHDFISGPGASGRKGRLFLGEGGEEAVVGRERFNVGSAEGVIALAKAGLGIAVASLWMCRAELAAGDVVTILPDCQLARAEVHAVFPAGRQPSRKVRALTDFLHRSLEGEQRSQKLYDRPEEADPMDELYRPCRCQ